MKNNLRTVCCLILSFLLLTMTACATSYGKTQDLIDAIEAQDASKVTELLNEGLDPNALSGPSKNIFVGTLRNILIGFSLYGNVYCIHRYMAISRKIHIVYVTALQQC